MNTVQQVIDDSITLVILVSLAAFSPAVARFLLSCALMHFQSRCSLKTCMPHHHSPIQSSVSAQKSDDDRPLDEIPRAGCSMESPPEGPNGADAGFSKVEFSVRVQQCASAMLLLWFDQNSTEGNRNKLTGHKQALLLSFLMLLCCSWLWFSFAFSPLLWLIHRFFLCGWVSLQDGRTN
jgi:hypothetical protein